MKKKNRYTKRKNKKKLSRKRLSNKKRSKKKLKGGMEGRGMTETEMAAQAVNRKTGSRHDNTEIMEVLEATGGVQAGVEEAALRLNVNKLVEIGFEEENARQTLEQMSESYRSIWVAGEISKSQSKSQSESPSDRLERTGTARQAGSRDLGKARPAGSRDLGTARQAGSRDLGTARPAGSRDPRGGDKAGAEEAALRLNVNKLVEIGFEEEKARKTLEGMNESFRSIWVAGKISKSQSQGTMEPPSQGTMEPPSQGTMEPPDTLQTQRGKFNAICGNKRLDPHWMRGVYGDSWTEEAWKKELFYKLNESAKIFGKEVVKSALQIELKEFPPSLEMKIAEAISLGKINPGKEYNIGIKVLNEFCEMINKWLDINQYKEYLRRDLVDLPKQEQEQEVQKRRDHQKWARENRAEAIAAAEAPAPAAVALEPAPAPAGSDDNIGILVEMGFNQVDAQEALEINQNDLGAALNFLLSGAPVHRRAGAASSRSPVGD